MRVSRQSPQAGFTLLELVVSLTILALMAGVLFAALRLAMNGYVKSQEDLLAQARERVLMDQVKRQLGSLFPLRPVVAGPAQQQASTAGVGSNPLLLSQAPLFYGTSESVTFVSIAPLFFEQNPGLAVVRYGLAEDEWGRRYLGAMEDRFMGLDSFNAMVNIPPGKPLPIVEGVEDVRFEYYGYDVNQQAYGWFSDWIGEQRLSVPQAVRIDYQKGQILVPVNAVFLGGASQEAIRRLIGR